MRSFKFETVKNDKESYHKLSYITFMGMEGEIFEKIDAHTDRERPPSPGSLYFNIT